MRRLASCLCLLALTPSAPGQRSLEAGAPVTALTPTDKRWALLIGVNEYEDRSISRLYGPANDALSMKKTLVHVAGFRDDQILVLANGNPNNSANPNIDGPPTRGNILVKLSNILRQVPKDGLFLLQFAGHGIERGGKPFLLPSDARLNDDVALLEETSLAVNSLRTRIQAAGISQVLIVLDACRNEPGGRADLANPLTKSYIDGFRFDLRNQGVKAFATLYATAVGERAWEDADRGRGFFSLALEEALRCKAANERGEVTLAGALRYLEQTVPKQVHLRIGPERRQEPFSDIKGFAASELVVAKVKAASTPTTEVAVARTRDDLAREAWELVKGSGNRAALERFKERYKGTPYEDFADLELAKLDAPRPPAGPVPGQKKTNPKDGLTYVWIPAGRFQMGCSSGDTECYNNEKPAKQVEIERGFWLGETEVTQAAYLRVMGQNPSQFRGADLPVEMVSWSDARTYCQNVGGRLPTEAEWEYAVRATSTTARYGKLDDVAWYANNSGSRTHPVGQKLPNRWNLRDMLGNVWEWTESDYNSTTKTVRGGSWIYLPWFVRSSIRGLYDPSVRLNGIGFRCVGE